MVVPARSGSRRVKDKNIRSLGGKPLLCWTLDAAFSAVSHLNADESLRAMVLLSTDSESYVDAALEWMKGAPWFNHPPTKYQAPGFVSPLRPKEISEDVDTGLVCKYAYKWTKENLKYDANLIVTLQPTSPFRSVDDIVNCVHDAVSLKADTVFTVKLLEQYPQWVFMQDYRHQGLSARTWLGIPSRYLSGIIAQDLPELYFPTGSVYVTNRKTIQEGRIYGERLNMLPVRDPIRNIDIETEDDLSYAHWLIDSGRVKTS